jgi:glycosyltransferase involved in cell wall biosynthesis
MTTTNISTTMTPPKAIVAYHQEQDTLLYQATSLCEAFAARKPLEEIIKHLSTNVVCLEHGLPQLAPFLGRAFHGHEGARDYFSIIGDLLDFETMTFSDYLVDVKTRQVSVRGEATFVWKKSNASINDNASCTTRKWAEVFMYRLKFTEDHKISRYEVWADSGAAYLASRGEILAPPTMKQRRKVLLVTYEFTYSPFSGNGILARSIAKALLHWGCEVTVWCCQPAAPHDGSNHLAPPEIAPDAQLTIVPIQLTQQHGWRKLDDESAWEFFQIDNLEVTDQEVLLKAATGADVICVVDWTGAHAVRSLRGESTRLPPIVYMNFRVYSSGMPDNSKTRLWFNDMERRALDDASAIIALSERDRKSLVAIAAASSNIGKSLPNVDILLPPLRGDVQILAMNKTLGDQLRHLPDEVASRLVGDNKTMRLITCVARLSPEKNVMRFVRFVEQAGTILKELDLIPLLAGSSADPSYATMVKEKFLHVAPDAIIIDRFLSPQAMVAIFGRAALNFHPCAYDAYGMTIVEAAACGVPSVIAQGGAIGASALIEEDSSLQVSMPPRDENDLSQEAVEAIVALLKDEDQLERLSAKAKQRALAWDEVAYGEQLLEIMTRVST